MPLERDEDGVWALNLDDDEKREFEQQRPEYIEALPRYLNYLDPVFAKAKDTSEFCFILSLLRVSGMESAGWDPFECTLQAIKELTVLHNSADNPYAARHLALWMYAHMLEASAPYEILANMLHICTGDCYGLNHFPGVGKQKNQPSPGNKIKKLEVLANDAGHPDVVIPLNECWDRIFRNAIFHADYALFGGEVRIRNPDNNYPEDMVNRLLGRTSAYFEALKGLHQAYIESYSEPEMIETHSSFAPKQSAFTIIREGYGLTGVKHAWSKEQLANGHINWRFCRATPEENELLEKDPTLNILPARDG